MNTNNLLLPIMESAQAQKHVTFNETVQMLDALLFLTVRSRVLTTPPASPADGDRYLAAAGASGDWSGIAAGTILSRRDGVWLQHTPRAGWCARVLDENRLLYYNGSSWSIDAGLGTFTSLTLTAAAESAAALPATPPTGWLRITVAGKSFRLPMYD